MNASYYIIKLKLVYNHVSLFQSKQYQYIWTEFT